MSSRVSNKSAISAPMNGPFSFLAVTFSVYTLPSVCFGLMDIVTDKRGIRAATEHRGDWDYFPRSKLLDQNSSPGCNF